MANNQQEAAESREQSVLERANRYKKEIEKVVREIGEHPLYELKRSCALTEIEEKIEFVNDVQSICTSKIDSERYLVIGADAKGRAFISVKNIADFDDARIRQLLEKYLHPAPQFEVFSLKSSDGADFLLFVFPRQRTRRVVARVTVDHPSEKIAKVLLRTGDLWIKGESTAKRLASAEDWDDIFSDAVEFETEKRTRQRTAHLLERVSAQEKLGGSHGTLPVASSLTDEEFRVLIENICISRDRPRFVVLLEGLRDDVVEGWHAIGTSGPENINAIQTLVSERSAQVRDHKTNVFMPAIQKLTCAAIYVVKNNGPTEFVDMVVSLFEEVFSTANKLHNLRWLGPRGLLRSDSSEHLSHTIPALETLISVYLVGAYATKRGRLEYLTPLLRTFVSEAGREPPTDVPRPISFWPLATGWGEPDGLQYCGGRIKVCIERVQTDPAFLKLFGSTNLATEALCAFELLLELNSFLAVDLNNTKNSVEFMRQRHPGTDFSFWPGLIAFPLENISSLSVKLLLAIKRQDQGFLRPFLIEPELAAHLIVSDGLILAKVLRGLDTDRQKLQLQLGRWEFGTTWPKEVDALLHRLDDSLKG